MAFLRSVFEEHLSEATEARNSYYEFDALWKAFNLFYSSLYREEDASHLEETELIERAIESVPPDTYGFIITQTLTSRFRRIQPIGDGRMWVRFERRAVGRHIKARRALNEIQQGVQPNLKHVQAIVDVLYLVRCNMAHGLKSRYDVRDREVFEATVPVLRALVHSLPVSGRASADVA